MSYKDTVIPIVKEVRGLVLPSWGNAEIVDKKSLNPGDVVTELDRKVETFLKEKLAEVYPDIGFVGEENGGDRDAKKFWLVDPIDGTGHYVRGLPFCTTMLALIEDSEVVFSVIYHFITDVVFWAEKGKGAYRDDERIYVSHRKLKNSYICFETHLAKEKNRIQMGIFEERTGYMQSNNSGWEFTMIASGKLDGRVCFDPWGKDYDFAPGTLLVAEAGGKVVNLHSDTYDFRNLNFIASNPELCKEIEEIFTDYEI